MNKTSLKNRSAMALHRMNSKPGSGHDGFDQLRQLNKMGTEFTKELAEWAKERAQLEMAYSKGLAKLSAKLFSAAKVS